MKTVRFLLGAAVALAAAIARATPVPPTADVLKQIRAIESAELRGEADKLRVDFREQAKNRPGDVMLRIYIAWCSMPSDDSWNEFKAIAAINPENPWVHYGMGRVYTQWKMRDQATLAFNNALKGSPKFFPALVGLGDAARAAGNAEDAEKQFRAALAISDDAQAHGGLGLALAAQSKTAEAKAELQKAIAQWPDQPEALAALGKIARDEKDSKTAADLLSKLCELSPKDRDARKALAELRFDAGDKEQAALEYERFLRLGAVDADVFKRLAAIYKELGKPEPEERAVQQLSSLEKTEAAHPMRIAELAEARGDLETAEAQLLEAAERAPARGDVQLKLARLRVKKNAPRDALESYRAAVALKGPEGADADAEAKELAKKLKVAAKPAKGDVNKIYAIVSGTLFQFYTERLKEKPDLGGNLKLRVRIDKDGKVVGVDSLEDSIGDPLIAGHVYFALKDAEYPKKKGEPVFEFELKNPGGKKK